MGKSDLGLGARERDLILACLRARYNSSDLADLPDFVDNGIMWSNFLSAVRRHGILPLVYESFAARGLLFFPEDARRKLRHEFRQSAGNSFLYAAELVRLSNYLQQRGIMALAFKGPTLALQLYGKLSLRTVRDLDLLVPQNQIEPALDVLKMCGYEPVSGSQGAPASVSSEVRKHILLAHKSLGFNVELHWSLADPSFAFSLPFEQLWAERQNIIIMDQPVATLNREHMLLIMCAHGTNHCWGSLKWICDIAQAVRAFPDLDWNRVWARAHTLGCRRMLAVGLALAREICGVQLPLELEPRVHSEKVDRICREVQAQLFVEREPVAYLERTLTFVRSRERFLDRIRILSRFIGPKLRPNARDRALVRLPDYLQAVYFPLRLVRLIWVYWKKAVLPMLQGAIDRFVPIPRQ